MKLREENCKLRQQIENMNSNTKISLQHVLRHKQFMESIKKYVEEENEKGIMEETNNYYTEWSKLGEERITAAELHLEQLKMLLLPTQVYDHPS